MRSHAILVALMTFAVRALAQTDPDNVGPQEIDACGVFVRGNGCVLFEGGGGLYVVADPGDFAFGEPVRIVGTVDPDCLTICPEADGCIRGAVAYDPAVLPCGTPIADFPGDLLTGICSAAGTAVTGLTLFGMWLARPGRGRGVSARHPWVQGGTDRRRRREC